MVFSSVAVWHQYNYNEEVGMNRGRQTVTYALVVACASIIMGSPMVTKVQAGDPRIIFELRKV